MNCGIVIEPLERLLLSPPSVPMTRERYNHEKVYRYHIFF